MSADKRQLTPIVQTFLEQLAALMAERNISQADLARRMDRPESYVSKILRGESNLTAPTIELIARAMGVKVDIQLKDPQRQAEGQDEGQGADDEATKAKNGPRAVDASPAPPLTRREEVRVKALTLVQELAPEVTAAIGRLVRAPDNPVGRPRGPVYDYTCHLHHMAVLLVSGQARSVRQAAKLTVEWAEENELVSTSISTLRRYFGGERDALLEEAKVKLSLVRTQPEPAEASEIRQPGPVSDRASRAPGLRDATPVSLGTPLSSYGWVTQELTRLQAEFSLSAQVMKSLQTPYVLEEIRGMVASLPSLDDLHRVCENARAKLEELRSMPEEVARNASRSASELRGVLQANSLDQVAAASLAQERAMKKAIEEAGLAVEALQRSPSFDNPLWRLKYFGHLMQ